VFALGLRFNFKGRGYAVLGGRKGNKASQERGPSKKVMSICKPEGGRQSGRVEGSHQGRPWLHDGGSVELSYLTGGHAKERGRRVF